MDPCIHVEYLDDYTWQFYSRDALIATFYSENVALKREPCWASGAYGLKSQTISLRGVQVVEPSKMFEACFKIQVS